MELTIAIRKDCKRLLTDNQPITCRRLQPFADIKVHVGLLNMKNLNIHLLCFLSSYKSSCPLYFQHQMLLH